MLDDKFKIKQNRTDYGWHSRGKIPHLDEKLVPQFVTFRLADSMPQSVLDKWRSLSLIDSQFRRRIEKYLDAGYGACDLSNPEIAEMVEKTLNFHAGAKYDLNAWVVMPNHGHALLTPFDGMHLREIMHSIKSYTAQQANKILGRKGQFWQHESFDRYIRNSRHFRAVVRYIEENPVNAGLCGRPEDWKHSSRFAG